MFRGMVLPMSMVFGGGLPSLLEYGIYFGILFLGTALALVSGIAYVRNRDPQLRVVSVAFSLFGIQSFLILSEPVLVNLGHGYEAELIEHSSPVLTLVALALFFVVLVRDWNE